MGNIKMPFLKINNQQLFYEDSEGSGPAVIFMHGFLMDQSMFDPQREELASKYRCIGFDARGFGKTIWDELPFSLYDTVEDCIGLMDHLGIKKAVIVGMSQGGYAALRLALRYKDRVQALVLMSTSASSDNEETKNGYREFLKTYQTCGPIAPLIEQILSSIIGPKENHQALWEYWRTRFESRTKVQITHAMSCLLNRDDIDRKVSSIEIPALVIHGDLDQGIPIGLAKKLNDALPESGEIISIDGAYHAANLTHKEEVNSALLSFLKQNTALKR